ncbi:MAG: hypothetical protein JW751_09640 [Polyangiaceae bacterium]|nr:hypothetical protein [Polyangiaceae bacterium]
MAGATTKAATLASALLLAISACGGSSVHKVGQSKYPPPPGFGEDHELEPMDDYVDGEVNQDVSGGDDSDRGNEEPVRRGEPEFAAGMSVQQAIEAAQGTERINIDQETLGYPLTQASLYEPCKVTANDHFKLKVAVWNGKAVGIDLDTKNEALKQCLTRQLLDLTWKDKVKSLNVVEYEM